jgi:glycosyltransferase involved in cell wall biosynthesis
VAKEFSLRPDQISVIYDGVDTETFRPVEVAKEEGLVLYVGNSDDRNKGARYLVEAMALLKDRDVHLTVVDRSTAWTVPTLAKDLGIADRVTLTGRLPKDELVRLYNACEVFVSPSLYEGFGLPAAEAMACGAPVIATTAGAFPEVIEDGNSGLLVPPRDARALAQAIERVRSDSFLRYKLGREGRRRINEHFSWRETAIQTQRLYEDVRSRQASSASLAPVG